MISIPGVIVGVVAGAVVATALFKAFFDSKADFWECVKYGFKPDFISWLDKDLQRDYGKSMKLGFYILVCGGAGYAGYAVIASLN